jgi:hypothetical protein
VGTEADLALEIEADLDMAKASVYYYFEEYTVSLTEAFEDSMDES